MKLIVFHYQLQAVKSETSGLFEFALLTILRCAENPAKYFAKVNRYYVNAELMRSQFFSIEGVLCVPI